MHNMFYLRHCNIFFQTSLHVAVTDNAYEIVDILLAFGADPSIKDSRGNSSLHIATAKKSTESLSLLVKNVQQREDLNLLNDYGKPV